MGPETRFKTVVLKDLKSVPDLWFVKTQQRATRGIPDVLLCLGGRFMAIELKKDEFEKPDPLQEYNLKKIREAGGLTWVAHPKNWKQVFFEIKTGEK